LHHRVRNVRVGCGWNVVQDGVRALRVLSRAVGLEGHPSSLDHIRNLIDNNDWSQVRGRTNIPTLLFVAQRLNGRRSSFLVLEGAVAHMHNGF
jgi:hypothetical protein